MSKKTKSKKKQEELKNKTKLTSLLYDKPFPVKFELPAILLLILVTLASGIYFIINAVSKNGYFGFPLDDPWIHLTFAKNLVEYGSFSYFKNEIVTSGSTSPIYTFLLSLFYLINKNEFIISYIIGIGFNCLTVFYMYKLFKFHFHTQMWFVMASVLVIAIQPKLNLISVSGMETTMFICLIATTLYYYKTGNKILLGILIGLTIWCRPDGFVLWTAIIIDFVIFSLIQKYNPLKNPEEEFILKKDFLIAFGIAAVLALIYFAFNYSLSGTILPNTYRAKLEYYKLNLREDFLKNDVINYFSSGEFIALWIPFFLGIILILRHFIKKTYNPFLIYLLFTLGLITAYYIKLPFAHRFGRYLMPVIPFYFLVALYGIKTFVEYIHKKLKSNLLANFIIIIFFGTVIGLSINEILKNTDEYTMLCQYHNDRHVAVGKWINQNTPPDAIIATHDIGAIAFYGNRKLIDMAGLVTPEIISHIGDENFPSFIKNYLIKNKVTYLAALRNWFEIVNDNPVFVPVNQFEILEVYKFKPNQTHIQPREVSLINEQAIKYIQANDMRNAVMLLQQSLSLDPLSSRTNMLLGAVYNLLKDNQKAEQFLKKAVEIFPDYLDANYGLAKINLNNKNFEEAKKYLVKCLEINPDYIPAKEMMEQVSKELNK